jgi:uncharacterized RDD family membrane protein YckC
MSYSNQDTILPDEFLLMSQPDAGSELRLMNWIIDTFVAGILLPGFVVVMAYVHASSIDPYRVGIFIWAEQYVPGLLAGKYDWLLIFCFMFGFYTVYMTLCEWLGKGRTLGKLFTRTRAVSNNGADLTFRAAFQRSLIRLIPFEMFSIFGGLWHDIWTKTRVIRVRQRNKVSKSNR